MKRLNSIIAGAGIIAGGLSLAPRSFAANALSHQEKAAAYEQKVVELEAVVAEHTRMRSTGMTDKTSVAARQKMEKHCDAIIADAAKLRDDYRSFASWHKMQATEEKTK